MRYLSVCSGIEAATVAWEPLGWECAGVSEIDKFPRAVLEHRLGAVPVDDDHHWQPGQNFIPMFGDFTQIRKEHAGDVDLLVGGTPCQSFSIAGKRLGLDDPRGNLALEFLALARRIGAPWILWENVPGVLSHDRGRTFGTFLGFVEECGYRWAYRTIDAQYARVGRFGRAVPQRRRRVFLVGYSGTADINPAAVLFDRESLRGNPAPRREAGQRPATSSGEGANSCGRNGLAVNVAPTLRAGGNATGGDRPYGTDVDTCDSLVPVVSFSAKDSGTQRSPGMLNAWGVRRLTPRECARLQGFPDDWAMIPWRGKPAEECPDGPQYKCYGNSMAVNVMCWIGERLDVVAKVENACDIL